MNLPHFTGDASFVGDWRSWVFPSQVKAAKHFGMSPGTISRYESGKLTPPLGYLACLAQLIAERLEKQNPSVAAQDQQVLLQELNRVIHSWYQETNPFKTWEDLGHTADDYRASRSTFSQPDTSVSQPTKIPPTLSSSTLVTHTPSQDASPFMTPLLPPQGIFGREVDLAQIMTLLHPAQTPNVDGYAVALRGMGGVGKTTLAMAVGRSANIAELFPDGVLWTALGPKPVLRPLLNQWGRALGVDLQALPDEAACQERLRTLLFHRRALLIVDDIWDIQHGRAFVVGGPLCRLLVTTRELPIARELAMKERTLNVDILPIEAALALLRHLAPEAVTTDERTALRLLERLEYLPLGVTLAGRLLASEAAVPQRMERLLQELIEHRQSRLQLLQAEVRPGLGVGEEPASLQAILGMSVERLDQIDQDRFAMLSAFGGEPYTWEIVAVANVWHCTPNEAEATVARFIQRGLVERRGDRFWMHILLADYAEEMRETRKL